MNKRRSLIAIILVIALLGSLMVGCKKDNGNEQGGTNGGTNTGGTNNQGGNTDGGNKEIKTFTAYFAFPGEEIPDDNRIMNEIANRVGAKVKMTYLTGQTAAESIGALIAGGQYPDFIDGSDGTPELIAAGALIPIDQYWDNYPNIKNLYSEADWNKIRKEDGHVYIIPQFGNTYGKDMQTYHNDEAFWLQIRVLEWAGYPEITTVYEYFEVIEDYLAANPTMPDGTPNIGFEILCDDWRYFCLENPPMFLDGYPNDGSCIVDPETLTAYNYNTTPTAKKYFNLLNEEFKKGIIDPETFTANYDQYIAKLSTGRVLGMVDQYWNFQTAENSLVQQGLEEYCYVPIGCVIEEGIVERYHSAPALDISNGIGITTSCKDIEGALQFLNDILSQEIQTLRYWGVEGVDYFVDENGMFYRNEEQRNQQKDQEWVKKNWCSYDFFPHHSGMNLDGKNAYTPNAQPSEYFATLSEPKKKLLEAYGCQTFTELLNPSGENAPWYPMWSYTNTWTSDTDYGIAKVNMDEVKHEYLPKVIMANDFEAAWAEYMKVLNDRVDMEVYEKAITEEVRRRVAISEGK